MAASDPSPSVDRPRRVFSRIYARISQRMEAEGMAELRHELLDGLAGEVVEIGCGNGMNFAHYPTTVTGVVAVEPEPYLRALASRAAETAPVRVLAGTADRLPLPDRSVDAAVLCLVMCSLDDRPAMLAELIRVLRPGGQLRFFEHTIADTPGLRMTQRIIDATVWPLLAGGCHTATDPAALITSAGFEITRIRGVRFPDSRLTMPTTPHVLGAATTPGWTGTES
ncbi:class I SAM-dependent methyltransferase [Pseudonocardia asaccharolytica]|uniref:Methyltransferase type 11 n=1 Tax=Pseudonocardia asaccharolytica DSM 44247 = NBRC 16224 TaxID=1123024 RepID=A0A511D6Q3_9PSEU|nr:class I SAM-dependent methyltransferase [Pseudonocardia asaccharolytica]GEL20317.1 methyltransferase type 11 [Pseudonocardia asaccharolytica DSM 44247 = NBRC 16224]